jgi:hypothetical protein
MNFHDCSYEYKCDYRTKYNTCTGTCLGTRYKSCIYGWWGPIPKIGRDPSCGEESYTYSCTYNCNPYQEPYNCGNIYTCWSYEDCQNVNRDCSGYETVTGYYQGTCYGSNRVCDKATNYSKCDEWSERMIAYDCSKMKLSSYSLSNNFAKIGDPLTASFYLENCEGIIKYTLNIKGLELTGTTTCNNTNINFAPVSSGTQTVILTLKDNYSTLTKSLGTLTITNQQGITETQNPFTPISEEFTQNIENGNYDAGIIEWINQGLSNEEILLKLMITFGAAGLAITATQANRIKDYIGKLRLSYAKMDISKGIKLTGKILNYLSLGVLIIGGIAGLIGFSVPIAIIGGIAGIIGLTGSTLEFLSHQFALKFELKDDESKKIYLENNSVEMSLDFAFMLLDGFTLGQGSKVKVAKEVIEEAVERVTKEAISEFSESSMKEISERILKRLLKESEEEIIEKVVKESFSPITKLLEEKIARYVSEETLDYFIYELSKQSDEVIEKITKMLLENPEYIKVLANPKFLYLIINIISEIPAKDLSKLTSALLSNSLDFFKKTGKIPTFEWVKSIKGGSPSEFVTDGKEFIIQLSKSKIDDLLKYSDFLIQHELKHYEYKIIKNIDYTEELKKYFDEDTAEQINNILLDAQIDAELAATNPIIKEQIKEYEKKYFENAAGKYQENNVLNFARLFYDNEIGKILNNKFKNALDFINMNEQYIKWNEIIKEIMKKFESRMTGFENIYTNNYKKVLEEYLLNIESKIELLFYNQELTTFIALTTHRLIYVIEKEDISKKELEKMIYSLAYYFLKDYVNIEELKKLSKMSDIELEKESKKTLTIIKKHYKQIEKKEWDIENVFKVMKKMEEMHK